MVSATYNLVWVDNGMYDFEGYIVQGQGPEDMVEVLEVQDALTHERVKLLSTEVVDYQVIQRGVRL